MVELMVTLSVLAILAALAAPGLSAMVATQRIRSMASDLHQALQQARAEAIKRNINVTLSPLNGSWGSGWAIPDPDSSTAPPLATWQAKGGVNVTTSSTQVVFRTSGRTSNATDIAFVFSADAASEARCVSVDPGGRPYAKKGSTC